MVLLLSARVLTSLIRSIVPQIADVMPSFLFYRKVPTS